jgi:hypothetical protein
LGYEIGFSRWRIEARIRNLANTVSGGTAEAAPYKDSFLEDFVAVVVDSSTR